MPNLSPGSGSPGPQSPNDGPFEPFQNEFRKLNQFLGFFFENPEESIRDLMGRIVDLPPEERFTESGRLLAEEFIEQAGSVDAADALIPDNVIDEDRVLNLMVQIFEDILNDTLDHVWQVREADGLVVFAAGHQVALTGFRYLRENPDAPKEIKLQVLSCVLGYLARLTDIQMKDAESIDTFQVTADVLYSLYYLSDALDEENAFPHPKDLSDAEIRSAVLEYGAAVVYHRLNISVGRGAELAEQSRLEFEETLDKFGVSPRYGPTSVDELHDGLGRIDG